MDLATTTFRSSGAGTRAVAFASADLQNAGGTPADIELRVLHDGKSHHGTFHETLIPGQRSGASISIRCDGHEAGTHTLTLQARVITGGAEVSVGTRNLDAIRFGPIFNPPG